MSPERSERLMTADQWLAIDSAIFACKKLVAVRQIRETVGCSLSKAVELLHERYEMLLAESPERFAVGPDRFWDGFYS